MNIASRMRICSGFGFHLGFGSGLLSSQPVPVSGKETNKKKRGNKTNNVKKCTHIKLNNNVNHDIYLYFMYIKNMKMNLEVKVKCMVHIYISGL